MWNIIRRRIILFADVVTIKRWILCCSHFLAGLLIWHDVLIKLINIWRTRHRASKAHIAIIMAEDDTFLWQELKQHLLMSVYLQKSIINATTNEWRKTLTARVRPGRKHFEHLLWASYQTTKVMDKWSVIYFIYSHKLFPYGWVSDFQGLKFLKGTVRTLNRWCWRLNHLSMVYLLSNIVPKITAIGQLLLKLSFVVGRHTFWDTVYTVRHKKHTKILLCITSRNINRFSKFFHCLTQEEICYKSVISHPTTP